MRSEEDVLKHNYIIEHLEKNKGKTKELIVLSAFCFDSRLWDIKPVFQYPIRKDLNSSYYYYDLYYPSINLLIEIDEEHHERSTEKTNDEGKEQKAKDALKCEFYRICFDEEYANIGQQIEKVKLRILELITKVGVVETQWKENQFDAVEFINTQEKTIIVSVSPKKILQNLNDMPLQLNKAIHGLDDVRVIYLTGATGTVANVFNVNSTDWNLKQGNSSHTGTKDIGSDIITSGSTFYKSSQNILLSPDLRNLKK